MGAASSSAILRDIRVDPQNQNQHQNQQQQQQQQQPAQPQPQSRPPASSSSSSRPSRLIFGGVPLSEADRLPESPFAGGAFSPSIDNSLPQGPLPQVQQTIHIKNDVNLDKDTMRLIPLLLSPDRSSTTPTTTVEFDDSRSVPVPVPSSSSSTSSSNFTDSITATSSAITPSSFSVPIMQQPKIRFLLQFTLDLSSDCVVTIFFGAKEVIDPHTGLISIVSSSCSEVKTGRTTKLTAQFSAGSGLQYRLPDDQSLDFSLFQKEELESDGTSDTFPLVVQLESIPPKDTERSVHSQFTYASFVHVSEDVWNIKPIRQKVQISGVVYEVFEIYGIHGKEDEDNSCVVCISDPKTITCLPCRHMCLCRQCATALRLQTNKCPICRSVIQSFLRVTPDDDSATAGDAATNEFIRVDVPDGVTHAHTRTRSGEQQASSLPPPFFSSGLSNDYR